MLCALFPQDILTFNKGGSALGVEAGADDDNRHALGELALQLWHPPSMQCFDFGCFGAADNQSVGVVRHVALGDHS